MTFAILLRSKRRDARFTLGQPLAMLGLRKGGWSAFRDAELRFPSNLVEARVLITDVGWDALASNEAATFRSN
ncbi:hypothetical protein HZZ13_23255 [Bradyrhizobium sp. CNPSo 4010]|uniref:Uncharacterized protein n=1 Tax=Bradyrhizobium agreste TaxID=2751811 RepID=A0ABS0PU04_9BRAD|nr:hypothetical protein [Bradyrhizobium agreste]MBH5400689.1 hypothetical protein [Bradyrhizobium agreste]